MSKTTNGHTRRRALALAAVIAIGMHVGVASASPDEKLLADATLATGGYLHSADGRFTLAMQGDGNLVIYTAGVPLWASNTATNDPSHVIMQLDGNLVVYRNADNVPTWASGTVGNGPSTLVMQDDGNLVVYRDSDGKPTWASNTVQTAPPPPPPPPAAAALINDPLRGSTIGAQVGGTLTPDGFRIDNPDDHITYTIATTSDGAAELSVRGLANGQPANSDAELFIMYDGSYSPDPETDYIGFRNNPFKFLVRKRGDDIVKIAYLCNGVGNEANSKPMSWDPNHTYRFRVEWGGGSARVYVDGNLVVSAAAGGNWAPKIHRCRVGDGGAGRGQPGAVISNLAVTAAGAAKPGPAPVPGQGPLVQIDPAAPSRLVANGKPFFWVGKTAFALPANPAYQAFLDECAANGVNEVRVLCAASPDWVRTVGGLSTGSLWPFSGSGYDPVHFTQLDNVVAYAGQKGIAVEMVLFESSFLSNLPDPTSYNQQKKDYLAFVVNRYKSAPNVVWEVANEYGHAGGAPYPYNGLPDAFVQAVAHEVQSLDPNHLVTVSDGAGPPSAAVNDRDFDLINIHTPRGSDFWKQPWTIFPASLGATGGRPQINDEPIGSDPVDQPGKRSSDGAAIRANMWVTACSGAYFTFHSSNGLGAVPGPTPGQEFLKPFHDFFDGVDLRNATATTAFVSGSGAAETYGCRRGDEELVVYLRGGNLSAPLGLTLPAGNFDVTVVDPATGATLVSSTIAGGATSVPLATSQVDVAVHLKKR
jgi:hypothetical protein